MKRIIGRINPANKNVTIWGAGFSGLILGHYLKGQGYKVTIFERAERIGGKIHTLKNSIGLIEQGPNALFMNADGMDLLKELNLDPIPATSKLRRLLLVDGKLQSPMQFGLLRSLILNGNKRPPLISDGLTVAEFFKPLIGSEKVKNFISPILGGVYAAQAEQLLFKSIFHDLSHMAQFKSYWHFIRILRRNFSLRPRLEISGSVSFDGGMQTLINRLANDLKQNIKLNHKESFRLKGNTIICTDALNASELMRELKPEFSKELARIHYQELSTVTVFLKREIKSLRKSFGTLIPVDSGFHSIGIVNNKAIFPANNQDVYSYTFILKKDCSKDEVYSDIKYLNKEFQPEDVEHFEKTYWPRAIPIYDLQRYLSIKKLHQLAQDEQQLAIFGNYVAGISLREMISAARKFAVNPYS